MHIWQQALNSIQQKIERQHYETWFADLKCLPNGPNSLVLAAPSEFVSNWLNDNYLDFVRKELELAAGREIGVVISHHLASQQSDEPGGGYRPNDPYNLNPHYLFSTYIQGESNQFAHAAAIQVAHNPGRAYNPMYIFGPAGVGKTHLIHALGNEVLRAQPKARVVYKTGESFMNELISSIRNGSMADFREKYRRTCDVLLMDDIHFLASKESTQEEFFHTFNELHSAGKQIVLTSDKTPEEISGLEDRLRTRFAWGLIADIQPPDLETRIAIIEDKAEKSNFVLPQDVIRYMAENIRTNVREIEGALKRLEALSSLTGQAITFDSAKQVLSKIISDRSQRLSVEVIQEAVARHFDVKLQDLKGPKRQRSISTPRMIAMFLVRKHTNNSYPEIGKRFGGKDHSTVINAVGNVERNMKADAALRTTIESIEKKFAT